jgi:hypothetical protein
MVMNEERAVARQDRGGPLAAAASPTALIDAFRIPDIYAEGGIATEAIRTEALAIISAGFRGPSRGDRPGLPQRSKDGKIILHDAMRRAPALERALEQQGQKRLTIAFPFDNPNEFIKWNYKEYSASELLAFGDDTHLMILDSGKGYRRVEAGTPEFVERLAKCKVSVFVYFCLARWTSDGPEISFDDGTGAFYCLRFTSRNSLRSILAGLKGVARFTQGRIAGVPFDLSIDYRQTAGKDGKRQTIPVWSIVCKPPDGHRLTSRNFSEVMTMAIEQGAALQLPALPSPTLQDALSELPDDDLDEAIVEGAVVGEVSDRELELIQRGGRCDADHWRALFFSAVRHTEFDGDESPERAAWLRVHTKDRTDSLAEFLHWATEREAQAMVVAANDELNRRRVARDERGEAPPRRPTSAARKSGRSYSDLFPDDEPAAAVPALSNKREAVPVDDPTGADPDPVDEEPAEEPVAPELTEAQQIVAGAIDDPLTFARSRADDWYDSLVVIAVERQHPQARKASGKKAESLDYPTLIGSIRVMLGWFPDVTVEQLDGEGPDA